MSTLLSEIETRYFASILGFRLYSQIGSWLLFTFIDKRCTIISINEKTYILLTMLFIIFDWKLLITDCVRLCRCTITEYELIFNLILKFSIELLITDYIRLCMCTIIERVHLYKLLEDCVLSLNFKMSVCKNELWVLKTLF